MTMLRESPISYSSVPQDEGGSSFTSVMTRPPGSPHVRRDCKLTSVIISLVIVTGISLAVILPLVLKERFAASGRDHLSEQVTWEPQNELSNTEKDEAQTEGSLGDDSKQITGLPDTQTGHDTKNNTAVGGQPSRNQNETTAEEDSNGKNTLKPVIPTTTTTTTIPTTSTITVTTTTTTTTTAAPVTTIPVTLKKTTVPSDTPVRTTSSAVPDMEGDRGTTDDTQHSRPGVSDHNVTKEEILNDIYGSDSSSKPGTTYGGWMNKVIMEHDMPALVVMAVLVAVAGAAVVASLAWLVYTRVAARRRRINIQSVITDLQSRDKVVLLNSEESEEE